MRAAIGVTILLVIIISSSLLIYYLTSTLYVEMRDCLNTMEKAVEDERWDEAEKEAELLRKLWHRGDHLWSPIMDHRQIDRIDESVTLIVAMAKLKSKDNLIKDNLTLEIISARRMLKRLKDKESPQFKTIF